MTSGKLHYNNTTINKNIFKFEFAMEAKFNENDHGNTTFIRTPQQQIRYQINSQTHKSKTN